MSSKTKRKSNKKQSKSVKHTKLSKANKKKPKSTKKQKSKKNKHSQSKSSIRFKKSVELKQKKKKCKANSKSVKKFQKPKKKSKIRRTKSITKLTTKSKPKKSKKSPKNDRLHIQLKKDIQIAKKRLRKKRKSILVKSDKNPKKSDKNTKKSDKNPKKTEGVHSPLTKDNLTANEIWNEYIFKFDTTPNNASQIRNFSKTNPNFKTLTYKQSQNIFDKFSDSKSDKHSLSQSVSVKQNMNNIIASLSVKSQKQTEFDYYFDDQKISESEHRMDTIPKKKFGKDRSTAFEIETFMESERIYVFEGLQVGLDTFCNRLAVHNKVNKSIISAHDIHIIFGTYQTIFNANHKLYNDLKELSLTANINALITAFGQRMLDFIPYFKIYISYIVSKQSAIAHLESLKKSNKAFKEFLKINELCVKCKLKSLLEEPAHRIPQYLEYLVNVYTCYKSEVSANNKGEKLLLKCIASIKKVLDEISAKCRDFRSRLLVGTLQKDLFGNKISLLSAHRFCIAYSSMQILLSTDSPKLKMHKFILMNDIFLISTFGSKFKYAQLMAVYPLIGLRVSKDMNCNSDALKRINYKYKLTLLPSSIVIVFSDENKLQKWIEIIKSAVERQEHSLKQCNIVDLEKRLRKQKTSKEGMNDTVSVTNPDRIRVIEKWKKNNKNSKLLSVDLIPKLENSNVYNRKRSKTFNGFKKSKEKSVSNTEATKVRVMRDEEVLQFDEEIPIENFMKALNSGFVKITNEEEQNEQYLLATNRAKSLVASSVRSYAASVFSDDGGWSSSDSDWD